MLPNRSTCNKAVTLGWEKANLWSGLGVESVLTDFRTFFPISRTFLRPLICQFLILTLKPIHYYIILKNRNILPTPSLFTR